MTDTKTEEASITEGIQALPIWPGILEVGPHRQKENTTSRMERHKVQRQETGKLTMATHPPRPRTEPQCCVRPPAPATFPEHGGGSWTSPEARWEYSE